MRKLIKLVYYLSALLLLNTPVSLFSQSSNIESPGNGSISKRLEDKIQDLVIRGNLPTLQYAVVSNDCIVSSKVYGKNSGRSSMYMIGSIQKVFNAIAILQLYEKGLLIVDNDISSYLPLKIRHPKYPEVPITIGMLLSHRSGLEAFKYQAEWDTRYLNFKKDSTVEPKPGAAFLPLEEFLKASLDPTGVNYDPSVWRFKPGTNYLYSNSAQYILCYLIEKVSGQTYAEYMHDNIFGPLEMNNTMFYKDDSSAKYAIPFTRKDEENVELPFWAGERDFIYSTAEDLAKFMIANLNNGCYKNFQLLKPETIELMQEKHSPGKSIFHLTSNCPFRGYGYGIIQYSNRWFGHGGSTIGYQSLWDFNKYNKSGYIILTNINGLIYGKESFNAIWRTVSAVEKLMKKELKGPNAIKKSFILTVIVGFLTMLSIIYIRRKL